MTADDLALVLKQIAEMRPVPFVFPADFESNIKACPECQGWAKNHPIQRGICDEHRKPLNARDRHEQFEAQAIGPRCQLLAQRTLDQFNRENKPTT